MKYRVCIPTAGIGTRLADLTDHVNKSLIGVANKPVISHIIEKFPIETEIVIALGYKKELVRDFLELAYPDRPFVFVDVDPYEGPGSGLGLSLLRCQPHLQCPFVFCSCDTLVSEPIPAPDHNWMGHSESDDPALYRSIRIKDGQVTEVCEKGSDGEVHPYIGLAGIKDYDRFWENMTTGSEAIEIGESYGLRGLVHLGITSKYFTWHDTGNLDSLKGTREFFEMDSDPIILPKADEAIWFVGNHVIKFSSSESFIANRVKRSKLLDGYCPQIVDGRRNMYKYEKVEGSVFSDVVNVGRFEEFLSMCLDFWRVEKLSEESQREFTGVCSTFYKDKTLERVSQFYNTFEITDAEETINGVRTPKLRDMLSHIDWDWLCDGVPARFHGDLHFENIIYNSQSGKFTLLDWRQDFGGNLSIGDVYYDLGKIYHGLVMSHAVVRQNGFSVQKNEDGVEFDFYRMHTLVECEAIFKRFLKQQSYDTRKVTVMMYLVFLNIAALHHYPYSLLLYYLGKTGLWSMLNQELQLKGVGSPISKTHEQQ